jgi:DNA-binding transcriptional ArsR family regulator
MLRWFPKHPDGGADHPVGAAQGDIAMTSMTRFAEIAAQAGNPARATMLHALLEGRALTANELAQVAGVAPQTGSGHLAGLVAAGLVCVQKQGRHRYHRLASPAVARMLESIMQVAADGTPTPARLATGPRDAALRAGRTCYDHLAGRLGVALADGLAARGHVELDWDAGLLTDSGSALLASIGVDLAALTGPGRKSHRVFCRPCLDWSERRPHIAGAVGAALCSVSLDKGWIRRVEGSRAVATTPAGQRALRDYFGVTVG